jgi:hypothetical protein
MGACLKVREGGREGGRDSLFHTMHHLFLVMEYVPGSDCAAMLRMYGCLPEGEGGREGEREGGSEGGKEEKRKQK